MSVGEGTMADGSPVTPELDARMLADLREWRARLTPTRIEGNRWSARLTIDELDMLLRRCAELDALKREGCEMPDERPSAAVAIPAGHALIAGEIVPLPAPFDPNPRPCSSCGHVLHSLNGGVCWVIVAEVGDGPIYCPCGRGA